MKNILYIGPYRQKDGWGQAAYNYLQSIIYATRKLGYNLKIAPVYFTGQVWESLKKTPDPVFDTVKQYEETNIDTFDTIIQKGLPESLWYHPSTNNIALTVLETQNMQHTKNKHILNKFNHILVPSHIEKETLEKANVKTPITNILEPINCEEIDGYMQVNQRPYNKYSGYAKFYFIGEFVPRKNILDLIVAFSVAFRSTDKVVLFIKTSSNISVNEMNNTVNKKLKNLKNVKMNSNIVFINQRLPRLELLSLHRMCDIFVCPSQGEAFCIPLAEGMRFGNIPIVVENTGPTSFVNTENGYIIPARPEICSSDEGSETLDSYSANEIWMRPTVFDLSETLKQARSDLANKQLLLSKQQKSRETTELFTFPAIGEKLCSLEIM